MGKRMLMVLACMVVLSLVASCGGGGGSSDATSNASSATASSSTSTTISSTTTSVSATTPSNASVTTTTGATTTTIVNVDDVSHWDSSTGTQIVLNGASITVNGTGAAAEGSRVTITSAGTYVISGTLTDGQVLVNTTDPETVQLVLNGARIACSSSAPIYSMKAKNTVIVLADNTANTVTDGTAYVFPDAATDEPNAAIFCKNDLVISGGGSLTVNANYNDGIASKDGIVFAEGTVVVNAADDGIRGKDYLIVQGGNITVNAKGDGLKSDNAEEIGKGYISVEAGNMTVTAGGDGFDAETNVTIAGGNVAVTSGGGSKGIVSADASAKGIKGAVGVIITGGTITVDSADDAIHSNGSITITGGVFALSTGDDGIHADESITINGGEITITTSYEGIESEVITINNGTIRMVSSDDGLNGSGGNDGSGMMPGPGGGRDGFANSGNAWLYINGGYMFIEAAGDGIDVNGSVEMTAGVVIVNGPTVNNNGALDHVSFKITGGLLVAVGSSGMAQSPGTTSTQNSLLVNFNSAQRAGSLIHIQTAGGSDILTFAPSKTYQSVAFSSPQLATGSTYAIYLGGSSTGSVQDGLYQNGVYTPGSLYTNFTISGVVTTIGNRVL